MVDLLSIAGLVIAGLIILFVGLYLANFTRSTTREGLGQIVRFAIIAIVAAIAFQQIGTFDSASEQADVAISQNYPTKVSLGSANVAVGGGGYVTGIYVHPLEEDLVYIRTDIGGFYRWNPVDKGWVPLCDRLTLAESNYYGGEALALDPNDPNIVYIAAGKYLWAGAGTIFKSVDRGATWTKLNLDLPMGGNEDKRWVGERLVVNPLNSNMVFFGSRRDGLWMSSDAGTTWAKVTSFPGSPAADIGITAIAFDKQVPNLVYVNAYGDGIYKSTDAGATWSKLAGSPSAAMRLAVANNSTLHVTSAKSPSVSKYTNEVWTDITPNNSQDIFNGLSVNPTNPDDVLVSSGETASTKIYQSKDGGSTWKEKRRLMKNTVPWWSNFMRSQPWIAAIEFDPKDAERVWLTDWYGIWRTDNINAATTIWTNYTKGHEEIVTFALVSPPSGALLLSGAADVDGFYHDRLNAYPSKTLGPGEMGKPFQDTYSIAYCESDPLKMVRVGGARWNSTYTGATSTNGGRTWKQFQLFPSNVMPMRVAMSATNPNLFVVTISEGQPIRTDDGGASWKSVSGLPNGVKGPWNWSQSLAADTVDGNTFYYYGGGKVYRSTDGGLSFEIVNASLASEDWHSIKTVPGVKGEVWVSLNNKGLYSSTDGGVTFSQVNGVERAYLFAFGKQPKESSIPALYLYGKVAGAEEIFVSLDRGNTWDRIGDRQSPIGNNPNVMSASWQQFGLVFIGTNGRGIYYINSSGGL